MNFENLKISFIKFGEIRRKAELFLRSFWNGNIPVDIENILEIKLKMDVIPVPGFRKICDTDALVTSDWKQIYVDHDMYMDERNNNRLRFSYAHEIGHLILHKEVYEKLSIHSYEDFYKFYSDIPKEEYDKIETQANIFASLLLVPRDVLIKLKAETLEHYLKNGTIYPANIENEMLNAYLAIPLAKQFGVSEEAMKNVLNNEDKRSK